MQKECLKVEKISINTASIEEGEREAISSYVTIAYRPGRTSQSEE
jgi:hypothetical protein